MRSSHTLDRLDVAFDDDRLVADAGLVLPATLAHHLGLRELVETHVDLGTKPGQANRGDKLLTLVMSALAGGDCIDDVGAVLAGGTARILGFTVKAASTVGTFLRSFRWGHVRQLDRVSRELLARAWAAGAGPGAAPLTIDLDSTICETYGLAKDGARHHTYTHVRGYHPLLAIAAGTGDVLMARLREGRQDERQELVARVRPARPVTEVEVLIDELAEAEAVGQGGRQEEPRVGHQAVVVEGRTEPVQAVRRSHQSGAPLLGLMGVSSTPSSQFRWAPDSSFQRSFTRGSSVDPG